MFTPLTFQFDLPVFATLNVADASRDDLGNASAGVVEKQKEKPIATAGPRRAWRVQKRLHFLTR